MPNDKYEFGEAWRERMLTAADDVRCIIDRGYGITSAVSFVGNHYQLSERQRTALIRGLVEKSRLAARREKERDGISGSVCVDGFNTVITLEVALSGSLIVACDDGSLRDLAGLHGTYRLVDKTTAAVGLMLDEFAELSAGEITVYLDRPVSNSGRLMALMAEMGEARNLPLTVELVPDVDKRLIEKPLVITSDGIILDKCGGWFNLNRRIVQKRIQSAWIYTLR